jgi:hypothetical protein
MNNSPPKPPSPGSEAQRVARGPLPPAPRPPGLPVEPAPPPYRGRLPTREELADHFASHPPSAPRLMTTPETLRPLSKAAHLAPASGSERAAHGTLTSPPGRRAPLAITLVALLASGFGMAAVWTLKQPRPHATSAVAAPAAATSIETAAIETAARPSRAADPIINPTQLPSAPDALFAVRPPHSALPCEAALGKPFVVESKPSPGRSSALWSRSRRSILANREPLALTQMCQAASLDLAGRAAYGLVEYYYQASDFQQALQWAERIPKHSPRYLDAQGMIGDIHTQRGDLEAALRVYADTWNVDTHDKARRAEVAEGFLNGAVYALEHNDAWSAERYARRAIVLNPANSRAALTLASAFARFDLREASLGWAERARELDR